MKTKKKFLTILLTVCLVMAMIPMTVLAADEVQDSDTWDGSVATAFAGGTGAAEDPYQISSGAELAYLARVPELPVDHNLLPRYVHHPTGSRLMHRRLSRSRTSHKNILYAHGIVAETHDTIRKIQITPEDGKSQWEISFFHLIFYHT